MAKRHRADETRNDARNVVHVALTPPANLALNKWADRTGAKKTATVARLLEWFAAAPESMQQIMVGTVPRDLAEQYVARAAEFFEEYARRLAAGDKPEESTITRDVQDIKQLPKRLKNGP